MDVNFWGFPPLKRGTRKLFSGGFRTTSRLKREYFVNETRYRQVENIVN